MQCCHCQWHIIITGWNQLRYSKPKMTMQGHSSEIGCFILYQKKKELCSPNPSTLDSCLGDDQFIVSAMKQLMSCHSVLLMPCFINSLQEISIYLNFHTFIGQQINKRSLEHWKLCRQDHGHQGGLISTHNMTQEMNQIFIFHVPGDTSVQLIGVMKNIDFGNPTLTFLQQKNNEWKSKLWRKGSKGSSNWFSSILHGIKNEKERD